MASSYAKDNYQKLDGVILLASYATTIMPNNLKCLAAIGSNDLVIDSGKLSKNKDYFNNEYYKEIIIEGANHANFGNYGV